jgi:hypothetical protein
MCFAGRSGLLHSVVNYGLLIVSPGHDAMSTDGVVTIVCAFITGHKSTETCMF